VALNSGAPFSATLSELCGALVDRIAPSRLSARGGTASAKASCGVAVELGLVEVCFSQSGPTVQSMRMARVLVGLDHAPPEFNVAHRILGPQVSVPRAVGA
jgi:hypothetical protein